MRKQKWIFYLASLILIQLALAIPLIADVDSDYNISDIALTPGPDASQLNFTWHTTSETDLTDQTCEMRIAKRLFNFRGAKKLFPFFPPGSRTFEGTWTSAGTDENDNADYYCKVTVDGLEKSGDYAFKLTDGAGRWSEPFDYTSEDKKDFGFLFVADSQIGASSGGSELSRSRDGKPYIYAYYEETDDEGNLVNPVPDDETAIEDYLRDNNTAALAEEYLTNNYSDTYTEEEIGVLVEAYIDGTLSDTVLEAYIDEYVETEIAVLLTDALADVVAFIYDPVFYDEYSSEGNDTDFSDVAIFDEGLAEGLLVLIQENIVEHLAAIDNDTEGWSTTMELMTDMFPRASFIVSGGDQVEEKSDEYEYTGFFTPYELTSIPVAPTYASHDRALNFEYHFNLPNESAEYGQDDYGVGDYYFVHGNTLFMVLNMDVTNNLFPRDDGGTPPGPPPGEGDDTDTTDTDGDGVYDSDDLCSGTPAGTFVDEDGCPLEDGEDYDSDGVLNENDLCNNTFASHYALGLIDPDDGCPYDTNDVDYDGVPDYDTDGSAIDRCRNTWDDLTVDEDGCADCGYLETDDELRTWIEELQDTCEEDEDTGETTCELDDFQASLNEHKAFIEEAIAANPQAKWKIVVWHYSIYSAAMHSTDDQSEGIRYLFTPMLEELDIDIVLMGHDHAYTKTYQMLDNEPQTDQIVGQRGEVINPTGILYLTASSSSGSKYYDLNCNIGDDTSSSAEYYEYASVYYENIPTFTYFEVDDNSLKFKSFSYSLVEDEESGTSEYVPVLIDEYAIEKRPPRWKKGWWKWW